MRALAIWAALLGTFIGQAADSSTPMIIPRPVSMLQRQGSFALSERSRILAGMRELSEAQFLAQRLRAATDLPLLIGASAAQADYIQLETDPSLKQALGAEGYQLTVLPERILIRAAERAGLFYGEITLLQLLPPTILGAAAPANNTPMVWTVPVLQVEDYPRFPWRGLLVDVGRHYLPVEFLKKTVDTMALHKLNTLQLHLTDDQGWRVEIKRYPRLTEIGSVRKESPRRGDSKQGDGTPSGPFFYTQQELRELVAYAQERHVTILPEIEMPGHFLSALAAYPEFSCRGGPFEVRTRWGVEADILCAGNDKAFEFVQNILREVCAVFPSPFIHIGGDEAPRERWKQCPKCQARMRSAGLKTEAELQTYFNQRIERFLASQGRRLIGWDEILEGGLPPGAAVMSWRGVSGGIAAANADHDVVMSPTSHCYLDYAQSQAPGEPESIGGYVPLQTVYAFEPVPAELLPSKRQHILGGQGNVWTEFLRTPADVEYFAYPRAARPG